MDESTPLVVNALVPTATRAFWYRWYVLLVYCGLVTLQGAVWNHWGPISNSMKVAFNWDNATLGLLPFWGPVTYAVSFYVWTLLMRHWGLRFPTLLSAALIAVGCGLKAIPLLSDSLFTIMCHVCGILNGFAGPVAMAAGTKLAAEWFPVNERVTAVAITTISQSLGPSLSFLIGPLIVPDVNGTAITSNQTGFNSSISAIRSQVALYNYIDLGVSCLLLLLTLAYFPNKPRLPPSISSQVARSTDKGLRHLGLNTWLIILAYGIPLGVSGSFNAVFDINVSMIDISQTEADWIGFISSAISMVVGLLAGRIMDCFRRPRMVLVCTVLLTLSTLSFAWFTLICTRVLPRSVPSLYASNILGISTLIAACPLFFEQLCESAFPVGEETVTMVGTTMNNIFSGLFLVILFFPQTGTQWMNYVLVGSCALAVPLLVCSKEAYHRRQIDLSDRLQD